MRDGPLRRRCEALVDALEITVPFDAAAFCERVAADRGRPIRRLPRELPGDGLFGMWVATTDEDLIVYESRTSRPHQDHIILHELGHLLCGHQATPVTGREGTLLLLPDLDPAMVERVLGRTHYSAVEEREAELVASLILQRASRWSLPPSWSVPPDAVAVVQRMEHSMMRREPGAVTSRGSRADTDPEQVVGDG